MLNIEKYKDELKEKINQTYCKALSLKLFVSDKKRTNLNNISIDDAIGWLLEEHREPILDDAEKEYLSAVIKPFRNRIRFIVKIRYKLLEQEFIYISVEGNSITFPPFKLGAKYKGMEVNIKYSLEELGL